MMTLLSTGEQTQQTTFRSDNINIDLFHFSPAPAFPHACQTIVMLRVVRPLYRRGSVYQGYSADIKPSSTRRTERLSENNKAS